MSFISTSRNLLGKGFITTTLALTCLLVANTSFALSPPNITTNIKWTTGFSTVTDIANAFNKARRQEEIQLGIAANKLGNLAMPAQTTWNSMSDDGKALYLINAERKARTAMRVSVLGLPLAGIENKVDSVSQNYAQLLLSSNTFGHYYPSNNSTLDNPTKRITTAVGSKCMEFLTRSENLAAFAAYSTAPIGATSIPMPIERAIYGWIYDDSGSAWGHREALLLQDSPLSNPTQTTWGYKNNYSDTASEGFLGFARLGSTTYKPFGATSYPYSYGVIVVMNVYDPVSTATATANNCGYVVRQN